MRRVTQLGSGWALALAFGAAHCRSAEPRENEVAFSTPVRAAETRSEFWRPCAGPADCAPGEECLEISRQPQEALLVAQLLEPRACAAVVPNTLTLDQVRAGPARYVGKLLLFRGARFELTLPVCTLRGCPRPVNPRKGDPPEPPDSERCCDRCEEGVVLNGYWGVPILAPHGQPLECEPRMDCEPPSCLSQLELDGAGPIAGAFREENGKLAFVLATDPAQPGGPDAE